MDACPGPSCAGAVAGGRSCSARPPGDPHGLPSAFLADPLRGRSFTVIDLGADTPVEAFVDAATASDDLVAVGITVTLPADDVVTAAVTALRAAGVTAPVVVGGRAVPDAGGPGPSEPTAGPHGWGALELLSDRPTDASGEDFLRLTFRLVINRVFSTKHSTRKIPMPRRFLKLFSCVLAGALVLAACGDDDESAETAETTEAATETTMAPTETTMAEPTMDIVETATAAGDFTTLVAAVEAAGLVETLQGDGPYTVFAPTDEAFAAALEDLGLTADELLADTETLARSSPTTWSRAMCPPPTWSASTARPSPP